MLPLSTRDSKIGWTHRFEQGLNYGKTTVHHERGGQVQFEDEARMALDAGHALGSIKGVQNGRIMEGRRTSSVSLSPPAAPSPSISP
jgi:hypothetical protein